jgi:hypothetical protein
MSSNLKIRIIQPDANRRGSQPLQEVLPHDAEKRAYAGVFQGRLAPLVRI